MAFLNILQIGDETLRKKSRPIDKINNRTLVLLDDMKETLKLVQGIGLAAPQVGVLRRIFIIDSGDGILEFINPEIVSSEGEQDGTEACLSVPGKYGCVKRPMKVAVRATDRFGKEFVTEGEELLARAFCHELDHLDGILYIDSATEIHDREEEEEE